MLNAASDGQSEALRHQLLTGSKAPIRLPKVMLVS